MKTVGVILYEKYCFMTFSELFRIANFFKASCADTFRKLENSRNSTNFHKIVRKNSENYHL